MKFTAPQAAAVNFGGRNLQLIACAGSGKTEVVAQRALKLLAEVGFQPRNIVAAGPSGTTRGKVDCNVAKATFHRPCEDALLMPVLSRGAGTSLSAYGAVELDL